jgi:transcriptional regulator with XRE-family HTH domain
MLRERIIQDLVTRKKSMEISSDNISKISGVSIATVKRTFSGKKTSLESIEKIATALGYSFEVAIKPNLTPKMMYELQLQKKADSIVKKILKTSALENQSPNNETVQIIMANTLKAIKQIPKSKIWV